MWTVERSNRAAGWLYFVPPVMWSVITVGAAVQADGSTAAAAGTGTAIGVAVAVRRR